MHVVEHDSDRLVVLRIDRPAVGQELSYTRGNHLVQELLRALLFPGELLEGR